MGEKRTFTVDSSNVEEKGGRYTSKNPLSAAKKAASQLFKKAAKTKHKTKKQLKFDLRETTNGTDKKIMKYVAKRVKLAQPKVVEIMGSKITYNYKIVVRAVCI
jgi:spore coat protein U-like protein